MRRSKGPNDGAVLERAIHDVATVAAVHTGNALNDRAFHKPFFIAANEALQITTGLAAFPDAHVEQELRRLQEVRNTLVHHDGRQIEFPAPYATMSPAELEARGLYVVNDYDYVYVIPGEEYLKRSTELVYQHVHDTARRVFVELNPEDA